MLQDFIIPSVLMGLGIAVDVAIATVVRFRDTAMTFRSWTAPVAVAHVLLPALGYYAWWLLGSAAPALSLPLGLLAFALISLFLLGAFCSWIGARPPISLPGLASPAPAGAVPGRWSAMMGVMAVSMDALWSGPAKASQVSSGGWGTTEVALILANLLRRIEIGDLGRMAVMLVLAKFAEMAVLGAFGFLALWNAFSPWIGLGSLFTCLGLSAGVSAILWLVCWKPLIARQRSELGDEGAGR